MDDDFKLKNVDVFDEAVSYAENRIQSVLYYPGAADLFCQLAMMHIRVSEYRKAVPYVKKYRSLELKNKHFAPWLRNQIELMELVERIVMIDDELRKLRTDNKRLKKLSSNAQMFIKGYPQTKGEEICLLWGHLLNLDTFLSKNKLYFEMRTDNDGNTCMFPSRHSWMVLPDKQKDINGKHIPMIELDISYPEFEGKNEKCVVFAPGSHPIELNKSQKMMDLQMMTGMVMEGVNVIEKTKDPNADDNNIYMEIKNAIDILEE